MAVAVPDGAYWRRNIPCQDACPVHTDARGYVRAIAEGDFRRAYLIARGPNPLASICGRICGAPCEAACRRGSIDKPIAIRALKRFVCEKLGAEARGPGAEGSILDELSEPATPVADFEEVSHLLRARADGRIPQAGGQRVAVIGSGPAGLSCAHDLALMGFKPVVFELEKVPGGMLAVGIPEYRLAREVIAAEVAVVESLGVEFRCGVHVGKDVPWADLRSDHAAVVVCVGAKRSRWLNIPGSDAPGILGGVDFLRSVSLGEPVSVGREVIVIGGGNVAFDVGRSVIRTHQRDVSMAAVRAGASRVRLCCLESVEEMPADDVEILEGAQEGIELCPGWGPVEFLQGVDGRVEGVRFQRCLSVFNEDRRFAPTFDPEHTLVVEGDTVLLTVGQAPDLDFLAGAEDGTELDGRGWLKCDPATLAAGAEGVFVAGDLAHGCKLAIHAIASGKKAARSVYRHLTGRSIGAELLQFHLEIPGYAREDDYESLPRIELGAEDVAVRVTDPAALVEHPLGDLHARHEASRCLDCGVNTIFDSTRCVLCGGCADVCPERCLRLVPVEALAGAGSGPGDPLQRLLANAYPPEDLPRTSAIIKDETRCLRCALCYQRCPVGAISMERLCFENRWVLK